VDDCEASITTLCCHAFVEQFPRLGLLVVDLNATQQCIAIISASTRKYCIGNKHCNVSSLGDQAFAVAGPCAMEQFTSVRHQLLVISHLQEISQDLKTFLFRLSL